MVTGKLGRGHVLTIQASTPRQRRFTKLSVYRTSKVDQDT